MSIILLAALWVGLAIIFGSLYRPSYDDMNFLGGIAAIVVSGAAIGFCVGAVQRLLLRRYLCWTADHWRRNSMIGGTLAACVTLVVYGFARTMLQRRMGYYMPTPEPAAMVIMPLFIGVTSVLQWMVLRHAVRQALLWVLANVVGGLVFSGMLWINAPRMDDSTAWLALVTAVLGQAFITGFVMLWLFEKQAYPIDDNETAAPQGPRSLWDDAI